MHDLTDDMALVCPVIDVLRASGCGPDWVLIRVELPPGDLPASRFPHPAQNLFWKAAADEYGEEHAGLHLVEHLSAFHGLPLEYLFLSSDTFDADLRHSLRYVRPLSDTLQAQLEVGGERVVLSPDESSAINRRFLEILAGAMIRLFSALTEGGFKPLEVQLMNGTGTPIECYRAAYGCPTILGMSRYALVFDAAVLDKSSRHATPELLRMHESLTRRQLVEVGRLDLVRQVHEPIGESLVDGSATLEQVAARLSVPARRPRERLVMAGMRFNDLVTDYRCRLARELLLKTGERVEVTVGRTGFSRPSIFYRAFKRWVGETPMEFRRRGQQGRG